MCLADWRHALAGCGAQAGAPVKRTWAELTTSLHRPPNGHLLEQQPGGGRLPAARPPPRDYPGPRRRCAGGGSCGPAGESRAHRPVDPFLHRPVLHAAGGPLFTATCVTNGAAINRRCTVGSKV
eukprot:scaffold22520_cov66-Phaeocystis_antarctica.AAC.1